MSYSNNWSISGITGLTSLKDCYQWNSTKRLYDFGMLRLKDGNLNQDDEVWIDSTIFPNSTLIQYYSIPKFFITGKNVSGVGYGLPDTEENSYKYSNDIDYPNNSNDNLKNWGFKQYPNMPYCAWVDPDRSARKARSILKTSTFIGLLADDLNSGNITWKMFTEESDGIREDTTLTIPNLEQIYNAKLGRSNLIADEISNTGLSYNITGNNACLLQAKNMQFRVYGWRVYKWGSNLSDDSLRYGYIDSSPYSYTGVGAYEDYLCLTSPSSTGRNYIYINSARRYYLTEFRRNAPAEHLIGDLATGDKLSREFIVFSKPRYRIYLLNDDYTFQIYASNNGTARVIGIYYDTEETYYTNPIWHILHFIHQTGTVSYTDSNLTSDTITKFRGNYWNELTVKPDNNFVVQASTADWATISSADSSSSTSVADGTEQYSSLTIPLLYDVTTDNRNNQIGRPNKRDTSVSTSGLFTYSGQSIIFPVFWSAEPKIWWLESINNGIVTYTLHFGNYKTPLTQNLMQLYGKDFEVKIYHSDQTTLLHTFTFSANEFPATNTSIKKEYRNGNNGCNLYLKNDYGYYRVYLTEVINGTEYQDSNHEFNKTYYLPWNTRATVMYNATVYIEKYSGNGGTLTGATISCDGRSYTSTTIENGKVVFNLVVTQLNQDAYVNSITTSDDYVLDTSNGVPSVTVSEGTNTCYIQTQYFGWNSVSNINVEYYEESGYSYAIYTIDFPKGFISTVQGTIYLGDGTTVSVNDNTSSSNDWSYTEPTSTSTQYIDLVLTAYDNTTRTRTYGIPQWSSETLSDVTTTINGHSYDHCYIYSDSVVGIGIRGYADGHYFSITNMVSNREYEIYSEDDPDAGTGEEINAKMTTNPYRIYIYKYSYRDDGGQFDEWFGNPINLTNIEVQHW